MDFFEALKQRRSVRRYADRPIPPDDLKKIVDAGRLAPSARGVEPWEFVVTTDKDKLKAIAAKAPNGAFIAGSAAAIIVFCRDTKYYLEDGCAATENVLLAAAALGIGTCWIAGDKKEYARALEEMFKAPADCKLVSIIALGFPQDSTCSQKQRSLDEVIRWETF